MHNQGYKLVAQHQWSFLPLKDLIIFIVRKAREIVHLVASLCALSWLNHLASAAKSNKSHTKNTASWPAAGVLHKQFSKFKLEFFHWLRPFHTAKNRCPATCMRATVT